MTVALERKLGAQLEVLGPASLGAHGFLPSQFQTELGPGNLARIIEMDDDYAAVLIPIDVAALDARPSRGAFETVARQLLQSSVTGPISLGGDTNSNPEEGVREIEFQLRLLLR